MVSDRIVPLGESYELTPLGRYLTQCQGGEPLAVELYDGQAVSPDVERWSVRDLGRGLVRAVLLFGHDARRPGRLAACESNREEVRRWLVSEGVPALRIGGKKKK